MSPITSSPLVFALVCGLAVAGGQAEVRAAELFPEVERYIEQRLAETEQIPAARRAELESLAGYVRQCRSAGLQRCGLLVDADAAAANPRYRVRFRHDGPPEVCFSKHFDDPTNPAVRFAAVMTCSQADEACPVIENCALRVAITYEDPKAADGTPRERAAYDERTRQISREMLYVMQRAAAGPAAND